MADVQGSRRVVRRMVALLSLSHVTPLNASPVFEIEALPATHVAHPMGGRCGGMPCLPGIDTMGRGFDIVRGSPERMQSIIPFTYRGTTYVNPFNASLSYGVPEGVTAVDNTHGQQSVSSSTYYRASTYAQAQAASAGASVSVGAFSLSASAQYYHNILEDSTSYGSIVDSKLEVTLYDITLPPAMALNTTTIFSMYLETLPAAYDKAAYTKFVQLYGTHYVAAATFGGVGHMSTAVNSVYSNSSSAQKVAAQASMHFHWVKAGGNKSHETDQSEASFRSGSEFRTSVSGGNPTDLTDWAAWEKTFYNAPAMIRYTLRPVSELVRNQSIARNVDQAVMDYAGSAAAACAAESDKVKVLNAKIAAYQAEIAQHGLYGGIYVQQYSDRKCLDFNGCLFSNRKSGSCTCPLGFKEWTIPGRDPSLGAVCITCDVVFTCVVFTCVKDN